MTLEEFKSVFAEDIVMVEEEGLEEGTILDDLDDWDSMAVVSLNATLDQNFDFTLNEEQIKQLKVFGDILKIVENKLK